MATKEQLKVTVIHQGIKLDSLTWEYSFNW